MNDIKPGKRRFHFESFWPKLEGFQEAVEAAWNSAPVVPCRQHPKDYKVGVRIMWGM
jgi:hypothetical protein